MPILRSAKKALRQSARRQKRNLKRKDEYKDRIKDIRRLATAGKIDDARKLLPLAYKALDKAAKTGVLKFNAASRKKSRLMKALKKTSA